jgi:hypothetical protein
VAGGEGGGGGYLKFPKFSLAFFFQSFPGEGVYNHPAERKIYSN